MAKITLLQGLPASGKSTKAQEILKAGGNAIRINRDLLREMLHFNVWSGKNEGKTRDAARVLAKHFLSREMSVVIDDTNLREGTVESWKQLAKECNAKLDIVRTDTPYDECMRRNLLRNEAGEVAVHPSVITGMAMQHGLYPEPEKGIVICDIDGTIANIDHRLHFTQQTPKDWKSFFRTMDKDLVREEVRAILEDHVAQGREIFFVSGRPDDYRDETEDWLRYSLVVPTWGYHVATDRVPYVALFMRRVGDRRPDTDVKRDIYNAYFADRHIVEVLDDRPRIIQLWNELGLNVRDVGSNDYFKEEREELNYWTSSPAAQDATNP